MRLTSALLALLLALNQHAFGQTATQPLAWALTLEGKDVTDFVLDARGKALIESRVPASLSWSVWNALTLAGRVLTVKHRFVSMTGCMIHNCGLAGFFWLDTKTGVGLGAISYEQDAEGPDNRQHYQILQIGSNGLSGDMLPVDARTALLDFVGEPPQVVEFHRRDGTVASLDARTFRPRDFNGTGPSFDCSLSVDVFDRSVCADERLSALDNGLFFMGDEIMRVTGGSSVYVGEALRTFMQDRQACVSGDVAECL